MKWSFNLLLVLCLALFAGCGDPAASDGDTTDVDVNTGDPVDCADDACLCDPVDDACGADATTDDTTDDATSTSDATGDEVSLNPPQVNESANQ